MPSQAPLLNFQSSVILRITTAEGKASLNPPGSWGKADDRESLSLKKKESEKHGFKTFQKDKGRDPIFLKLASKSLAGAKLTNGKKPHHSSYRTIIQVEGINLAGQRNTSEKMIMNDRDAASMPALPHA